MSSDADDACLRELEAQLDVDDDEFVAAFRGAEQARGRRSRRAAAVAATQEGDPTGRASAHSSDR